MSLEKSFSSIFDKSNAESSASLVAYNTYLAKCLEEVNQIDISGNITNIAFESQVASRFSEPSKASAEVDCVQFSQELEKILSNHLKHPSVIEKNVQNTYKDMLGGLKTPYLGISPEDTPKENLPIVKPNLKSTANKDSPSILAENFKKPNEINKRSSIQNTHGSLRTSTFAFTNRIFCLKCCAEVFTDVQYEMKKMNLWGSIGFFFESFRCCGEPRALNRYQEIIHSCKTCGTVLARISAN